MKALLYRSEEGTGGPYRYVTPADLSYTTAAGREGGREYSARIMNGMEKILMSGVRC